MGLQNAYIYTTCLSTQVHFTHQGNKVYRPVYRIGLFADENFQCSIELLDLGLKVFWFLLDSAFEFKKRYSKKKLIKPTRLSVP